MCVISHSYKCVLFLKNCGMANEQKTGLSGSFQGAKMSNANHDWWVVSRTKNVQKGQPDNLEVLAKHPSKAAADKDISARINSLYAMGSDNLALALEMGHVSKYTQGPAPEYAGKRGRKRGAEGKLLCEFASILPSDRDTLVALLESLQSANARDEDGHKWSKSSILGAFVKHCLAMNKDQQQGILNITYALK
jgi:hypothetical protein